MTLGWHCPTLMLLGAEGLGDWLATRAERRVTVLVEPAVAGEALPRRVLRLLRGADSEVGEVTVTGTAGADEVVELAERLRAERTELLVAIGGGTVLDRAKLAVSIATDPDNARRLTHRQRAGLVVLPAGATPALPLVAVPTTVGTGAELSSAACLEYAGGRRLVLGDILRPDVAVVDPAATAGLPGQLLAEGVLEALFRAVSTYGCASGDTGDTPTEDALAEALIGRLAALGDELARVRDHADPTAPVPDVRLRGEIAKVSGLTQGPWSSVGRDRYAAKGWFLANELSWALDVRKMQAVAALLPPLWRVVTAGVYPWGSARRLARAWQTVRAAIPAALPDDPAEGIATLLDSWQLPRRVSATPAQAEDAVRRTVRAWGGGLPMLRGIPAEAVREVVSQAVTEPRTATAASKASAFAG